MTKLIIFLLLLIGLSAISSLVALAIKDIENAFLFLSATAVMSVLAAILLSIELDRQVKQIKHEQAR